MRAGQQLFGQKKERNRLWAAHQAYPSKQVRKRCDRHVCQQT